VKEHLLREEVEVELVFMKGVLVVEERLLDEDSFFDSFHFSSK
jgi:hypothetical protein